MSLILVISGPAGVGKTTICNRLLDEFSNQLTRVVTTTTRKPRKGERHGEDYYFTELEEFKSLVKKNAFLEHEVIHGNYYGTSRRAVCNKIKESKNVLINIDVAGAKTLSTEITKENNFEAKIVSIFLKPNNLNVLKQRLNQRGSDSTEEIDRRLKTAKNEILLADNFNHTIISNEKDRDYSLVKAIYLNNT